jgi:hypothetical protein
LRTWILAIASAVLAPCLAACGSVRQTDAAATIQPAAAIISSDGNAFIGLGDRELANALGRPQMVRKDAPAEIWQYRGADCVVDFYLYDSDTSDNDRRMEVAYVEARDMLAGSAPTERCVKSLLQWVSAAGQEEPL